MRVQCEVNGVAVDEDVEPRLLLSDFLRHRLRLTGTHVGCEIGVCGACTVIMDGEAVRACLTFAVQAEQRIIRTIEGIANGDELAPLQKAFSRHHALQCGYCTPGILMTLEAAKEQHAWPKTESEARALISGNICRCTGYQAIVDAILELRS